METIEQQYKTLTLRQIQKNTESFENCQLLILCVKKYMPRAQNHVYLPPPVLQIIKKYMTNLAQKTPLVQYCETSKERQKWIATCIRDWVWACAPWTVDPARSLNCVRVKKISRCFCGDDFISTFTSFCGTIFTNEFLTGPQFKYLAIDYNFKTKTHNATTEVILTIDRNILRAVKTELFSEFIKNQPRTFEKLLSGLICTYLEENMKNG